MFDGEDMQATTPAMPTDAPVEETAADVAVETEAAPAEETTDQA